MADDGWIWGSKRGGGGAPLKDSTGAVITNLRLHAKQVENNPQSQPSFNGNNPPQSYQTSPMRYPNLEVNTNMDYNQMQQQQYYQQQQQMYALQMPQQPMYQQPMPQLASPTSYNNNNNGMASPAPTKFMSALRDMNSNPGERDEKSRKDQEYQAMLRRQIEEDKRRKEEEIAKTNPEYFNSPGYRLKKQKEDDAMRIKNGAPTTAMNNNNNNNNMMAPSGMMSANPHPMNPYTQQQQQFFGMPPGGIAISDSNGMMQAQYPPAAAASNQRMSAYNPSEAAAASSLIPLHQLQPPPQYTVNGATNDTTMKSYVNTNIELQNLSRMMSNMVVGGQVNNNNHSPSNYLTQPPGMTASAGAGGGNSRLVSQQEYDALSSLCNQLQQQQQRLEQEIRQQAQVIKSLEVNSARGVKGKAPLALSPTAANAAAGRGKGNGNGSGKDSLLRTRSEQQPRDKRNNQLLADDSRNTNSSRVAGSNQQKSAALGIKTAKQTAAPTSSFASPAAQQSKFLQDKGKNVFENDHKAAGKLARDNSMKKLTPSPTTGGCSSGGSGIPRAVKNSPSGSGGGGGFQKLMNQKQPVVISYGEDTQGGGMGVVGTGAGKRQQQAGHGGSSSHTQLSGSYTGRYSESELPLAGQSEYVRWGT